MNSKLRLRARFVFIAVVGAACLIVITLYRVQILKGESYANRAEAQYARPSVSIFDRGSILFQTKDGVDVAAASIARGYFLYLNPKLITNADQTVEALSQYVTLDKNILSKGLNSTGSYAELMHKLDSKTADSIRSLKLAGVGISSEAWRSYPGGSLAAQTLGIIGENASSTAKGRYGIERSYDDVLTRPSQGSAVNVFADLFSGLDTVFGTSNAYGDVVTTIEPTVETYVEKVLSDTSAEWHPDSIGGIVMDPQTGDIVALASLPSFDPNDLSHITNVSVLANPLVEHVYEMGSIMKPLTMAVGIDTGAVTRNSTYDDVGCMVLDKKKICNYDGRARGVIPMQEILNQSLNIGAATVALKVGKDRMADYFSSFGLGTTTGIDLPNEATGIIGNLTKKGQDIDVATASYGQGIATSPVETARALAVLANGGYLVTPHVVKEIQYIDGTKKVLNWPKEGPVLKPETVSTVADMLVTVVDTKLANGKIKMDHYSIGAKTGTAQIADHVNGGYYPDRYLHSFFGFFPAHDPKFIIFLYQIYPKGALYASETLTKPFDDLAKFLINYYSITPDR
ncbi:MAG TPA: penicillin-binding protein 2 [Candidatus Paceibacterota bacterium]|nr:penicillin-binding protein 2 [Candidatus Paceibacterota bacterium]